MSDIKFRLGLDSKEFDKGLKDAKSKASGFSVAMDDIAGKIKRSFGAGDVFKGLLQGLGIGSAEKLVEIITSGYREAAEHAKAIADYTERSLKAVLKLFSGRRTDEQNLTVLKKDQRRDQRDLVQTKDSLSFHPENYDEAQKSIAELDASIKERAVEIEELERKIAKDAQQKAKELADAQDHLKDARKDAAREAMRDEEKLVSLDNDRRKAALESLDSRKTELERTKAATKEAEAQKEIAALRKKISEDEARIAEKAAQEQKKRREEAEKLNKELDEARTKEKEGRAKVSQSKGELRDARSEQFAFSLSDAANGTRGSRGGNRAAKLVAEKTGQMERILDGGDYQVAFGDDGAPTLTSRDPNRARDAEGATKRFRKLYQDREGLRGSINNLAATDKDPMAQQKKSLKEALDESKKLEQIRKGIEGKFVNQGDDS